MISNIGLALQTQALAQPDQCALRLPRWSILGRLTYREVSFAVLEERTQCIQAYLTAQGVEPSMRTIVALPLDETLIATIFALFRLGAVPVLMDPGLGVRRILKLVLHTKPSVFIGNRWSSILSHIGARSLSQCKLFIRLNPQQIQRPLAVPVACAVTVDTLAAILFTSGSTGEPKGVHYTHGMFQAQLDLLRDHFNLKPGGIDYPLLGVFALFNPALGITTVLPKLDPRYPLKAPASRLLKEMSVSGVTQGFGSPMMWQKLGNQALIQNQTFPSMRQIFMAGCSTPPGLVEVLNKAFPNAAIQAPYGATEALPLTSINEAELHQTQADPSAMGTCLGCPLPGIELCIVPLNNTVSHSEALFSDSIGEIAVRGPVVSACYDQLPAATAASKWIDAHGRAWHRMGDCGYQDSQGRFWFLGRCVELVFTKTTCLYPDFCEAIFLKHPSVQRAALVGVGQSAYKTPAMVLVLKPGFYPSFKLRASLTNHAHAHLWTQEIECFYFRKSMPVDVRHNAKIHRLALARYYTQSPNG